MKKSAIGKHGGLDVERGEEEREGREEEGRNGGEMVPRPSMSHSVQGASAFLLPSSVTRIKCNQTNNALRLPSVSQHVT